MCPFIFLQEARPERGWYKEWPQVPAQHWLSLFPSPSLKAGRDPEGGRDGWWIRISSRLWGCSTGKAGSGILQGEGDTCVSFTLTPDPFPDPLAAPVAEKTKEQASHLGGAVFSGAGNIAAATGLVKKEEFPTDLKVSNPLATHMHACVHMHTCARHTQKPATGIPAPPASLGHKPPSLTFCDLDPDLTVYTYSASKCDLDHFWPCLHVSLIIHSFLFVQQVFMPERNCSRCYHSE